MKYPESTSIFMCLATLVFTGAEEYHFERRWKQNQDDYTYQPRYPPPSGNKPQSGYRPQSGYSSGYQPQSGYSSGYSGQSGYSSGYQPQSGYSSGYQPQSGYSSGYSGQSGYSSGYQPQSGYSSGYQPQSGYSTGYSGQSGYSDLAGLTATIASSAIQAAANKLFEKRSDLERRSFKGLSASPIIQDIGYSYLGSYQPAYTYQPTYAYQPAYTAIEPAITAVEPIITAAQPAVSTSKILARRAEEEVDSNLEKRHFHLVQSSPFVQQSLLPTLYPAYQTYAPPAVQTVKQW